MKDLVGEVVALLTPAGTVADGSDALRQKLRELAAHHPDFSLHLVAHREPYDGSTSYDVLIRGGDRAVSVGVAGSPDLPWPLRAVVRADEQSVVRVNGQLVSMATAVNVLEDEFGDRDVLRRIVHAVLAQQAVVDDPIEVSDVELQRAADAYRRAKGLYSAARTREWMAERGLNEQQFAEAVLSAARLGELRRRVVADRVAARFAEHREKYTALTVAWVVGPAATTLQVDPLAAVLSARDGGVTRWRMGDLPAGARALASSPVGVPVEVELGGRAATAVVLGRTEAVLDEATSALVARDAFTDWLEDRRRRSDVEWFWSDPARTGTGRPG